MPDVTFYYDGTGLDSIPSYSKGKTTRVASSVSESRNTSFDSMGRLLTSQQITDGQAYSFGYAYNLSGALIEETYPSGRVVKNTLNSNGELAQVQSKKNSSTGYWTYASSFSYSAAGAVTSMQLGNGHWETSEFNERLQVTKIGLGTTDSLKNILELDFGYTGADPTNTVSDRNNGSMRSQTIKVPAVGSNAAFDAVQTYTYDTLNRIASAAETVSSTQTWKQTFSYDRYGNRTFDAANTTTLGSCSTVVCNPTIGTSNNRFSTGQGYSYDADGAVTQDATGQRFGYDSEDRQKEFYSSSNAGSTPDATYTYDGEGKRIKKVTATEMTVFVYDASSKLVAEYTNNLTAEYWAGLNKVSYLTTDHLGSPRVVTDQNGAVISRKDFTAFGEAVSSTQRTSGTTGNGYDHPEVRQDYTGHQKDDESGLEYAQARYYNSGHGRFTSPDPLTASASIRNPQTLNRYSYVLNSPYKFSDPLGLFPAGGGACSRYGGRCVHLEYRDDGDFEGAQGITGSGVRVIESARDAQPSSGQQPDAGSPAAPPHPTAEQNQNAQQRQPIAQTSATVSIPMRNPSCMNGSRCAPIDYENVTVTVTQENNPTLGVKPVQGTPRLLIGVNLTFAFSDSNGPIANASVLESVVDTQGTAVIQTTGAVSTDSRGRGSDLISNVYLAPVPGSGESDPRGQLEAIKYFNKDFTSNQNLTLSITLPSGNRIEVNQQRSLTNTIAGAPRVVGPIHGYTFNMQPPTIRAIP